MSFTLLKYKKWEEIGKKQDKYDDVIIFDYIMQPNPTKLKNNDSCFACSDFAPTYKFDANERLIRLTSYDKVVKKANKWLQKSTIKQQWSVVNCETLYAKILINFSESGEIKSKRVAAISKWQLLDETFLNFFDSNQNFTKQNPQLVFEGRYIVQLLRIWLARRRTEAISSQEQIRSQQISFIDYWPKIIPAKEYGNNKMALEKMHEVTDRINLDIANQDTFLGPIFNVYTLPCYSGEIPSTVERASELMKSDQIVNVMRVFYDCECGTKQDNLIGFADFIPECISGGGLIKYPKFEKQSKLVQKASKWLAQNPELRFLNASSVDIKLKSMTSIDSSEMSFTRNTGDFIRILRLCYTKPYEIDLIEIGEISSTSVMQSPTSSPPPPPIYLNRQTLVSLKNSNSELMEKLREFSEKDCWSFEIDISNRYKFLSADSLAIFSCNSNKMENISENSFHAISISSSMMNRSTFNAINLFFDTGYFGKEDDHPEDPLIGNDNVTYNEDNKNEKNKNRSLALQRKKSHCFII